MYTLAISITKEKHGIEPLSQGKMKRQCFLLTPCTGAYTIEKSKKKRGQSLSKAEWRSF